MLASAREGACAAQPGSADNARGATAIALMLLGVLFLAAVALRSKDFNATQPPRPLRVGR